MKKLIKAFSLIELIIWITISMLLMVSVGVFISSWMQNILIQQKVLENTDNFTSFATSLHSSFNLIQSWSIIEKTASWIIFKRWQNLWEGGFTYIWTQIQSWIYCESDSDNPETNSIFIKNFIPFEEQWEDIFTNYIWILSSKEIDISGNKYISYQKEHVVKKDDWTIVIWKWIFWDNFEEWASWTDIYLNSPTWLATDWTNLYISDTLNNRILYLDSSDKIHLLLDKSDWLNEPTWLYHEDNSLYIANSWNWEILKYSSKTSTNKKLNIDFTIDQAINNLKKFEIEFYSWVTDITEPNNKNDFTLNWLTTYSDYLISSTNKITYYFSNFSNNYATNPNSTCSSDYTKYYEWSENKIIKEEIIDCNSSTWTIKKYNSTTYQNITNSTNIKIKTNPVTWNDFDINWNYYVKLKLVWDTEYSEYFHHFTKSDNDLSTIDDNILTIHKSGLNYPTWIWWTTDWEYNNFTDWTYSNLTYNNSDTLLLTPIKSLIITNSASELITFLLKYYKRYNCYNIDDNSEKIFLLKKNLK